MTVQEDVWRQGAGRGGTAVAVGPERARPGVPGEPEGGARRALAWVRRHPGWTGFIAILAILAVVGIAGGLTSPTANKASTTGLQATLAEPASGAARSASAKAGAVPTAAPGAVPALPTRVIKTGSLNLSVPMGRLLNTMSIIGDESTGLRGFVASSTTNTATPGTAGTAASGDITLRVPVVSFDTLLADVEKLGRATSVATSGQDVTGQYVDLQARIHSLEDARSQFQQILTRAQSIGDVLSVEQQINNLQTEIEQLQGQLEVLDNQSSYSTLTAHVVEATVAAAPRPASGLAKAWLQARRSFTRGFDSIVAFSGGLALFLGVVGFLAILARLAWVFVRRTV